MQKFDHIIKETQNGQEKITYSVFMGMLNFLGLIIESMQSSSHVCLPLPNFQPRNALLDVILHTFCIRVGQYLSHFFIYSCILAKYGEGMPKTRFVNGLAWPRFLHETMKTSKFLHKVINWPLHPSHMQQFYRCREGGQKA